jgi:thiamine biosynthesis lipoprotein
MAFAPVPAPRRDAVASGSRRAPPLPDHAAPRPCADAAPAPSAAGAGSPWIARAQVWLGTLVEIALPAAVATEARFAAGFAAIAHVQRTMSAHDADSDLGRIARYAHRRDVGVDPDTFRVLALAQSLWRESDGAFDPAVAPVLARRGRLPAHCARPGTHRGTLGALQLRPGHRVRTATPLALDLGGIAKGYAVDRAVAALVASGAAAGLVNAGGDLRAFGDDAWTSVRIRHPDFGNAGVHLFDIRAAAVATSADTYGGGDDAGAGHGPASAADPERNAVDGGDDGALVDPRTRRSRGYGRSITVVAPNCALADALTKIVALRPAQAPRLLAGHGAVAFCLAAARDARGAAATDALRCTTTWTRTSRSLRLHAPGAPPAAGGAWPAAVMPGAAKPGAAR